MSDIPSSAVTSIDALLVESEARYRAIIENASDMIQSVRPDATFEFVNRAWHRILGYTEEDLARMTIWDVIHPDALDHCRELFIIAMHGQSIPDVRTTFITKDGRAVPVEGSVTVRMLNGELLATHAFFRDISERLHAEDLEARNAQLEQEQRARYLEKMAALGKLSAGLAHELNNPASAAQRASAAMKEGCDRRDAAARALRGCTIDEAQWSLLESLSMMQPAPTNGMTVDDPVRISEQEQEIESWLDSHDVPDSWRHAEPFVTAGIAIQHLEDLARVISPHALGPAVQWVAETLAIRQTADIVARSTSRMADLVGAVKAYSYMDRAAELQVDVHEGLENTLMILAHRLKNTMVVQDYDRTLPVIRAHGSGLNQVWTNLLDNAIDATGPGGTVTIRTFRDDDDAVVEISDNGYGIEPEHLTRIFEPFFTTKAQGQGSGLGLDIVWRIIAEDHKGRIDVRSEPGATTFRIALPIPAPEA